MGGEGINEHRMSDDGDVRELMLLDEMRDVFCHAPVVHRRRVRRRAMIPNIQRVYGSVESTGHGFGEPAPVPFRSAAAVSETAPSRTVGDAQEPMEDDYGLVFSITIGWDLRSVVECYGPVVVVVMGGVGRLLKGECKRCLQEVLSHD